MLASYREVKRFVFEEHEVLQCWEPVHSRISVLRHPSRQADLDKDERPLKAFWELADTPVLLLSIYICWTVCWPPDACGTVGNALGRLPGGLRNSGIFLCSQQACSLVPTSSHQDSSVPRASSHTKALEQMPAPSLPMKNRA